MKSFLLGAIAIIGIGSIAYASESKVVTTIERWTVRQFSDPMTDEKSCVAYYDDKNNVQVTNTSFAVMYRGRGGISSYQIRLDDQQPSGLRLPSDTEKKVGAFVIKGRDFAQILQAQRVRVQALTVLSRLENDDVDMKGVTGPGGVLEIVNGTDCN